MAGVPDWRDVDFTNLEKILNLGDDITTKDCSDFCALKFLLTYDVLEHGEIESLETPHQLVDKLVADYDGKALVPELLYHVKRHDALRILGLSPDIVERRLYWTEEPYISKYRQLLHLLNRSLDSKDLSRLKLLSSGEIAKGELSRIWCGHQLFVCLEKRNLVHKGDVSFLKKILRAAKLNKLAKEVEEYQESISTQQRLISSPGPYDLPDQQRVNENVSSYDVDDPNHSVRPPGGLLSVPSQTVISEYSSSPGEILTCAAEVQYAAASGVTESTRQFDSVNDIDEDSQKVSKAQLQKEMEDMRQKLERLQLKTKQSTQDSYKMASKPRGLCVIINNMKFSNQKPRQGSMVDEANLLMTFRNLHFQVEIHRDCDYYQFKRIVETYKSMDHTKWDCFAMCILSHGNDGHIICTDDEPFSIRTLMSSFDGNACKSLSGKPKLFFVQACQGRGKMFPSNDLEEDGDIPEKSDMVLSLATFPGHVAYRSKTEGSWYVTALCGALDDNWRRLHLVDILIEVNRAVADAKAKVNEGFVKQCPAPTITLRKALWFKDLDDFLPPCSGSSCYQADDE